jgi:hypothetical protein
VCEGRDGSLRRSALRTLCVALTKWFERSCYAYVFDQGGRQALVQVVGGFKVRFTHRTSWKAEIRLGMDKVAVAPVVWTIGRRLRGREILQEVRFQDLSEMEQARVCRDPFLVVLAVAEDYNQSPRRVRSFQGVFWVRSTGVQISLDGIETTVIGRERSHDYLNRRNDTQAGKRLAAADVRIDYGFRP